MIDQHKLTVFKQLFDQAQSVMIIYAPDALRDHLFAATALYKTFKELGSKDVSLLSSENLSSAEQDIVYLDETKTEIGHKNLCITLDYSAETVEKITSAIDETAKKLHLTIKPKSGSIPLSKENVSFSYTGAEADLIILVGVDDLESLEQLYIGYENVYQSTALVSINSYETSFGNLKLDILGSSCVSEYVAELIRGLNYELDQEAATNLLAGIDEETENLESYLATADTFEIVSFLMRSGARRFVREPQNTDSEDIDDSIQDDDDTVFVLEESEPQVSETQNLFTQNINTQENSSRTEETKIKRKKGRGRPKGSKNKGKSKSKPGDLNYTPSGFGPSAT